MHFSVKSSERMKKTNVSIKVKVVLDHLNGDKQTLEKGTV